MSAKKSMPAPPKGTVWVLKIDPLRDSLMLWVYKRNWLTGRSSGWSIMCESVHIPGRPVYEYVSPEKASVDEISEAVIVAANEVLQEFDDEGRRRPGIDAKATELAERLGIKVEVKR